MKEKNVHTEHCCIQHGCKYGDEDCPVATGRQKQSFACESCDMLGGFYPTQFHVEVQGQDSVWRLLTVTPFDTLTEVEEHIEACKILGTKMGAAGFRIATFAIETYYIKDVKDRDRGEIMLYPYELEMMREKLKPLIITSERPRRW